MNPRPPRTVAEFYAGEIRENISFIKSSFKTYEQMPISNLIQMLDAPTRLVEKSVNAEEWSMARNNYRSMIQVCNSCHAAAQRPFVVIEPVEEAPAFNQRFKPKTAG